MKKIISTLCFITLMYAAIILIDTRSATQVLPVNPLLPDTHTNKYEKIKQLFNITHRLSQTDGHLLANSEACWKNVVDVMIDPQYKAIFQAALAYEREAVDEYAVFYHAERNAILWSQLLYTALWESKYNHPLPEYLFTRFPSELSPEIVAKQIEHGKIVRTELIAKGRKETQSREEMSALQLPCNYALFGNSKIPFCCSVQYLMSDYNLYDPQLGTPEILALFSSNTLYEQYKNEFDALEREFKSIVPHSVLLQVLLPHALLKEYVYLSIANSWKTPICIYDFITDDINTVISTIKTDPYAFPDSDMPVFRIAVTPDAIARYRQAGVKMRIYGCFDYKMLQHIMNKLKELTTLMAIKNPELLVSTPS